MVAFASALFWNSILAAILAGIVASVSHTPMVRRRPAVRNALWLLVLVKLITPPLIQLPVLPPHGILLENFKSEEVVDAAVEAASIVDNPTEVESTSAHAQAALDDRQHPIAPSDQTAATGSRDHTIGDSTSTADRPLSFAYLISLGLITASLAGTAVLIGIVLARAFRISRVVSLAEMCNEQLQQESTVVARTLGLPFEPTIRVVDAWITPVLWARPAQAVIVLPQRLVAQLDHASVSSIVAHELAHWVRQDHWTNWLAFAVAACYWWNPVAWYAYRQLRESQEECCDAMLLVHGAAKRRHYAETLLAVLEFLSAPNTAVPVVSPGIGTKHSLQRRFEMLRDTTINHRLSWLGKALVASLLILLPSVPTWSEPTDEAADSVNQEASESTDEAKDNPSSIDVQQLIEAAKPGDVVQLPRGIYTEPVEINKPLTLRGDDSGACIFEVTSNSPALSISAQKNVKLESLTIKWQLATSEGRASALQVTDSNITMRNCRLYALGSFKRSPVALQATGFSNVKVEDCWFEGFEFTLSFQGGSEGRVVDSVVKNPGHCGISVFDGSSLQVTRCIVTGSEYHGIRSTGGKLVLKDNLIIENANRGVYLGNKSAQGSIVNNVLLGNGSGISAFAQSKVTIANNVFLNSGYAGLDTRDTCRLTIRGNIFQNNPRGFVAYAEAGRNQFKFGKNAFWANESDTENFDKPQNSISVDPQFKAPTQGDYTVQSDELSSARMGLMHPEAIQELWKKWQAIARK